MVLITTQIEIALPPAHVREVFLDFAKMPEWHQGHFKSIEPVARKSTIEKGDKVRVDFGRMSFSPVVLDNSDREFKWRGSLPGIFSGDHSFRFESSKITQGSTTFVQSEEFYGLFAFLMKPSFQSGAKTMRGFEGFNNDLKSRIEGRT